MLVLKIPIGLLLWLVWWAVHQTDDPSAEGTDGDGGTKVRPRPPGHRPILPRTPRRRGPHGDPTPPSPARTRTTVVRSRDPKQT